MRARSYDLKLPQGLLLSVVRVPRVKRLSRRAKGTHDLSTDKIISDVPTQRTNIIERLVKSLENLQGLIERLVELRPIGLTNCRVRMCLNEEISERANLGHSRKELLTLFIGILFIGESVSGSNQFAQFGDVFGRGRGQRLGRRGEELEAPLDDDFEKGEMAGMLLEKLGD